MTAASTGAGPHDGALICGNVSLWPSYASHILSRYVCLAGQLDNPTIPLKCSEPILERDPTNRFVPCLLVILKLSV